MPDASFTAYDGHILYSLCRAHPLPLFFRSRGGTGHGVEGVSQDGRETRVRVPVHGESRVLRWRHGHHRGEGRDGSRLRGHTGENLTARFSLHSRILVVRFVILVKIPFEPLGQCGHHPSASGTPARWGARNSGCLGQLPVGIFVLERYLDQNNETVQSSDNAPHRRRLSIGGGNAKQGDSQRRRLAARSSCMAADRRNTTRPPHHRGRHSPERMNLPHR